MLYYRTIASCMALSEVLKTVSHDRLTRLLQADWSGHTLLELACGTLFVWERGYLIIDARPFPSPLPPQLKGSRGSSLARNTSLSMASPWCCWSGRMGRSASRSVSACGTRAAPRSMRGPGVAQLRPQSPPFNSLNKTSPRLRRYTATIWRVVTNSGRLVTRFLVCFGPSFRRFLLRTTVTSPRWRKRQMRDKGFQAIPIRELPWAREGKQVSVTQCLNEWHVGAGT